MAPRSEIRRPAEVVADERDLLWRARAGDRDAFDRLAVRLLPRLLGTARRMLHDELEAEEVVAQALVRAHAALPGFREASALSTWVHRILCRLGADRLRLLARQRRRERPLGDEAAALPAPATADSRLDADERRARVRQAVDRLPTAQRLALILVAWEGLELAEAARVLDMRYATLKSNLHHAREALRTTLRAEGGER